MGLTVHGNALKCGGSVTERDPFHKSLIVHASARHFPCHGLVPWLFGCLIQRGAEEGDAPWTPLPPPHFPEAHIGIYSGEKQFDNFFIKYPAIESPGVVLPLRSACLVIKSHGDRPAAEYTDADAGSSYEQSMHFHIKWTTTPKLNISLPLSQSLFLSFHSFASEHILGFIAL